MYNPLLPNDAKRANFRWLVLALVLGLLTACAVPVEPTQPAGQNAAVDATSTATAPDHTESADIVFTRHREGGIAGFCDDVIVYASGEYQVASCRGAEDETPASARLTDAQLDAVNQWVSTFQSFEYGYKDPAMADAMTVALNFYGTGDQVATEEQQLAMVELANELFLQVAP